MNQIEMPPQLFINSAWFWVLCIDSALPRKHLPNWCPRTFRLWKTFLTSLPHTVNLPHTLLSHLYWKKGTWNGRWLGKKLATLTKKLISCSPAHEIVSYKVDPCRKPWKSMLRTTSWYTIVFCHIKNDALKKVNLETHNSMNWEDVYRRTHRFIQMTAGDK